MTNGFRATRAPVVVSRVVRSLKRMAVATTIVIAALGHVLVADHVADAGPAPPQGDIVDDPGPDWSELPMEPLGAGVESRGWFRGDELLVIFSAANDSCETLGQGGRAALTVLVAGSMAMRLIEDSDGIARYEGTGDVPSTAGVFSTSTRSYAVHLLALAPDGGTPSDLEATLDGVVRRQLAHVAATGGGDVIATPPRTPTRLDDLLVRAHPTDPTEVAVEATFDTLQCADELARPLREFLSRNTETRAIVFSGGFGETSALMVDLTEYPYDAFAAFAIGTDMSGITDGDGANVVERIGDLRDVQVWEPAEPPGTVAVLLRRGPIVIMVQALEDSRADAREVALAAAAAQAERLPDAASAPLYPASPARRAVSSAALAGGIGVAALGVRRARSGRSRRVGQRPIEDLGVVVRVDAVAARLRRLGRAVTLAQLVVVVTMIAALGSGIGVWAPVGGVGVLAGLAITWLGRLREDALLGRRGSRTAHRWSWASAIAFVAAVVVLLAGGTTLIFGLRELVLIPSLTQLRLSDRLGIAPDRLRWLIFATGALVLVAGALLYRYARALARVGWGRVAQDRAPVVYLRSFHDDALRIPTVLSARRPFVEWFGLGGRELFEESIAWDLALTGPVIAIGRPGASRATLGAAREHIADNRWQSVIGERLVESALIAIVIGTSDGLAWELAQIAHNGCLHKALLVVPPTTDDDIAARWAFTRRALADAGADVVGLDELPSGALIVAARADRPSTAFLASSRDEATYRAALAAAAVSATAASAVSTSA